MKKGWRRAERVGWDSTATASQAAAPGLMRPSSRRMGRMRRAGAILLLEITQDTTRWKVGRAQRAERAVSYSEEAVSRTPRLRM